MMMYLRIPSPALVGWSRTSCPVILSAPPRSLLRCACPSCIRADGVTARSLIPWMDVVGACGAITGLLDPCMLGWRITSRFGDDLWGAAVAGIIPRWEWRVFGTGFGAAEEAFADLTPGPIAESDEVYLSVRSRQQCQGPRRPHGHQVPAGGRRRRPGAVGAGEGGLPACRTAEVPRVFDALGVLAPPLTRDAYTLDQFLAELVEPSDAVRVVRVHKRRQRYTLANCMAEVADLEVDGRAARTIAVESEDPSAVIAAVGGVGLDGQVNTSYPRGLRHWTRTPALRGDRRWHQLGQVPHRRARPRRELAGHRRPRRADTARREPRDQGAIAAEPLERTVAAIADMVEEATRRQVRATAAVGPPGCGSPATARRSSRRSGPAPGSPWR